MVSSVSFDIPSLSRRKQMFRRALRAIENYEWQGKRLQLLDPRISKPIRNDDSLSPAWLWYEWVFLLDDFKPSRIMEKGWKVNFF